MITTLESIMRDAATRFKDYYSADKTVRHKGAVDLVTEFDVALEKELTVAFNTAFPDFTVIGEESAASPLTRPGKVIYLDPIDGTTSFVHGFPFCGISAGFYIDHQPVLGCVAAPILGEIFTAGAGKGAYCNGEKLQVSNAAEPIDALICTGFSYDKDRRQEMLPLFGHMLDISRGVRRTGSAALDLCYVAKGVFDIYYEVDLKPWDMAAGLLIVKEAGGRTSDIAGKTHDLSTRLLLASNGQLHEGYLEEMRKVYKEL
jgi:myo-inositol-1(or 4)-monophosphatase